jgi:hypothetical protein
MRKLIEFCKQLEWSWSLAGRIMTAAASFALPAWAVEASEAFARYSPLSWVVAGFAGVALAAAIYLVFQIARRLAIRSRFDARAIDKGTYVNPLDQTFENKRIFLHDFALPSHPIISGKTFINCIIIGPANIFLEFGNSVNLPQYPVSDAVYLPRDKQFYNGFVFRNCMFRGCSFQRITMIWGHQDYENIKANAFLRWISLTPDDAALRQESLPGLLPPGAEPGQDARPAMPSGPAV